MSATLIHHTSLSGKYPAIILIHGMACDESDWALQARHFAELGHQVVTVDLRGHGQSTHINTDLTMQQMGADVAAVLRSLSVARAIVVGHSMGCRVATETALNAPDMVVGVALIDGSRFAKGDAASAISNTRATIDKLGWEAHMQATFKSMFLADADQQRRQAIIDRALARPPCIGIPIMLAMVEWDASDFDRRYAQLCVPVQVLQSSHVNSKRKRVTMTHNMVIPWHQDLIDAGVNAVVERVQECGHFTMLDEPGRVNATLEALLLRCAH